MPKRVTDMVGKEFEMKGGLFSSRKEIPPTKFTVLDYRFGSGIIMNMKTMTEEHPTVEFLVKNGSMKRSRWTRGFPIPEIDLKNIKE